MRSFWIVACLIVLAWCDTKTCFTDVDCTHGVSSFCSGEVCIQYECIAKPSPCMGVCNETLRACVECNSQQDCLIETMVCDSKTHKCRFCRQDSDCSAGTYCTGGHFFCLSGQCTPPTQAMWPCDSLNVCDEQGRHCYECSSDAECGTWDYCSNPRHCNLETHLCQRDVNAETCTQQGKVCNSQLQACVECNSDLECKLKNDLFCQPKSRCKPETHTCYWDKVSPCPTSNNQGQRMECRESQKACVVVTCENNAACSDGNDCNGMEQCLRTGCGPAEEPSCPPGLVCDSNGHSCIDPNVGQACQVYQDCQPYGLICRPTSKTEQRVKTCIPCRTHAQCSDGDPSNGEELCNPETNRCIAGVDPCQDAASGLVYNPMTGKCDGKPPGVESEDTSAPVVESQPQNAVKPTSTSTSSGGSWLLIILLVFILVAVVVLVIKIFGMSCCMSTKDIDAETRAPFETAKSTTPFNQIHKTFKYGKNW